VWPSGIKLVCNIDSWSRSWRRSDKWFHGKLCHCGIDAVTFNFLYTEQGRRVPDPNSKLEACYRAVIETVRHTKIGQGRLAIGGKSMGGRIASQVAAGGFPDVAGLVYLGYPLHPPGKNDQLRAKHLPDIKAPMLRMAIGSFPEMCNLYSITRTQEAMRRLFRIKRDLLGNFLGLYERALAIQEKELGAKHPDTAMTRSTAAALNDQSGETKRVDHSELFLAALRSAVRQWDASIVRSLHFCETIDKKNAA
jgi:pimeloyl-ACP methyl ester carboxylesterase